MAFVLLIAIIPGAMAATFTGLEFHLDDHNSDILFDTPVEYDSLEVYDNAVEIDENVTIKSNHTGLTNSTITSYDILGRNKVLEVETSAEPDAVVDYSFDGPDGKYSIEKDGSQINTKVVHENINWSNQFQQNTHSFTLRQIIERKVWLRNVKPYKINTDPKDTEISAKAYATIPDNVDVEFTRENGSLIKATTVENQTKASVTLGENELDTKNEYTGNIKVSDGKISETYPFNFSTIVLALSWNDTSNIEDGYIIESNITTEEPDEYREIYDLPQDTEKKRVTHPELEFNQTACFRIKAYNVGGISEPVEKCKNTPEEPLKRPWN